MTGHPRSKLAVIFGLWIVLPTSGALADRPTVPGEVGWIGLYNEALITWLENENQLEVLCSQAGAGNANERDCRDGKLRPKELAVQLRHAPDESAAPAGTITIRATPGQGLRAYYRPARNSPEAGFVPDLFDTDWGYGPYFHQTFLERRGTWFRLPAGPFPGPLWLDGAALGQQTHVRLLETGDIITLQGKDLVVLGMEYGVVRVRQEQAADMWCQAESPPPLRPSPEQRIPVKALYGPTGHLRVDIKYKRGC